MNITPHFKQQSIYYSAAVLVKTHNHQSFSDHSTWAGNGTVYSGSCRSQEIIFFIADRWLQPVWTYRRRSCIS